MSFRNRLDDSLSPFRGDLERSYAGGAAHFSEYVDCRHVGEARVVVLGSAEGGSPVQAYVHSSTRAVLQSNRYPRSIRPTTESLLCN